LFPTAVSFWGYWAAVQLLRCLTSPPEFKPPSALTRLGVSRFEDSRNVGSSHSHFTSFESDYIPRIRISSEKQIKLSMRAWHLIPQLSILPKPVLATAFQSNCILPTNIIHVVYSGNVRGTFDILWSCVFTLLICTWTVQHLNIPEQTLESRTWRSYLKVVVKKSWT